MKDLVFGTENHPGQWILSVTNPRVNTISPGRSHSIFTARIRSLWAGKVFIGVCLSVCSHGNPTDHTCSLGNPTPDSAPPLRPVQTRSLGDPPDLFESGWLAFNLKVAFMLYLRPLVVVNEKFQSSGMQQGHHCPMVPSSLLLCSLFLHIFSLMTWH